MDDALYEKQLEIEHDMINRGRERYLNEIASLADKEMESVSSYGSKLLKEFTTSVADGLKMYGIKKSGISAKATKLIKDIDPLTVAFISLRIAINTLTSDATGVKVCAKIGEALEQELKLNMFKEIYPSEYRMYSHRIKAEERKGLSKIITLNAASDYLGMRWVSWGQVERVAVGAVLMDIIIITTNLLEKVTISANRRRLTVFRATEDTLNWIKTHMGHMEIASPEYLPCVIPPRDWVSQVTGGYHSDILSSRLSFVKIKNYPHANAMKGHKPYAHMHGVSLIQRTGWKVNTRVLCTIKEVWNRNLQTGLPATQPYIIPERPMDEVPWAELDADQKEERKIWKMLAAALHRRENTRVSKLLTLSQAIYTANMYKDEPEFYFVWNTDFRGRAYCATSGMSPQGTEIGRSLMLFSEGMKLGDTGEAALRIHGANCFGVDKCSNTEREQWVHDNIEGIMLCAKDPMDSVSRAFWGNADKPYKFLAFCFEYSDYILSGEGKEFVSYLPCAIDGTCNGLQHFSALLRDPIGGAACNLTSQQRPEDIYHRVAEVVTGRLEVHEDKDMAEFWLDVGIDRKLTKKPTMTKVYGSTLRSCQESCIQWMIDYPNKHGLEPKSYSKHARFLAPVIWDAIKDIVVAAFEGMDWFRECAKVSSKAGVPMRWVSPSGFKIFHGQYKIDRKTIYTCLDGATKFTVGEYNMHIDRRKQANGIAPHFVHSMDAAHMVLTTIEANSKGVHSFAMVHDDYGTHAGNIAVLHECIRNQFVDIYHHENTLLDDFVKYNIEGRPFEFPEPPPIGELDINGVKDATYFFN